MSISNRRASPLTSTMREFRAAPAKVLRRAARSGAPLHLGDFILSVREGVGPSGTAYGAMAATARLLGEPSSLLSTQDEWADALPREVDGLPP